MPNHPESERSVLGAMLRSNEAALLVLESLTEDDFYDPPTARSIPPCARSPKRAAPSIW